MRKEKDPPGTAAPLPDGWLRRGGNRPALANPEKSGDAKLRNYGAYLVSVQRRYVRRTATGKPGETRRRKGWGLPCGELWYGSPPAG